MYITFSFIVYGWDGSWKYFAHESLGASGRIIVDRLEGGSPMMLTSWCSHLRVILSLWMWAGPMTFFRPVGDGKSDGMWLPWLRYISFCLASRQVLSFLLVLKKKAAMTTAATRNWILPRTYKRGRGSFSHWASTWEPSPGQHLDCSSLRSQVED